MPSCLGCSKSIARNGESIECCSCSKRFHLQCANLTLNDRKAMEELGTKWSCSYCTSSRRTRKAENLAVVIDPIQPSTSEDDSAPLTMREFNLMMKKLDSLAGAVSMAVKDIAAIDSKVDKIASDLRRHEEVLNDHTVELDRQRASLENLSEEMSTAKGDIIALGSRMGRLEEVTPGPSAADSFEIMERVRRSHNIMIRRLPEVPDGVDIVSVVKDVVDHISPGSSSHLISCSRIGSQARQSPKPILANFSNPSIVRSILRNRKLLCTSSRFREVGVSDDVTPLQARLLRDAREELNLRQTRGESNLTIRYVRGTPTVVDGRPAGSAKN